MTRSVLDLMIPIQEGSRGGGGWGEGGFFRECKLNLGRSETSDEPQPPPSYFTRLCVCPPTVGRERKGREQGGTRPSGIVGDYSDYFVKLKGPTLSHSVRPFPTTEEPDLDFLPVRDRPRSYGFSLSHSWLPILERNRTSGSGVCPKFLPSTSPLTYRGQ